MAEVGGDKIRRLETAGIICRPDPASHSRRRASSSEQENVEVVQRAAEVWR